MTELPGSRKCASLICRSVSERGLYLLTVYLYKEEFRFADQGGALVPCKAQPQVLRRVHFVTAVQVASFSMGHHNHKQTVSFTVIFTGRCNDTATQSVGWEASLVPNVQRLQESCN